MPANKQGENVQTVIIGATGSIGMAIANLLIDTGHDVVRVSRTTQPSLNLDEPTSIDMFYQTIGEVDAIICAAGNASFGPLSTLSDEQIRLGIDSKLLGQVNLVRKGLAAVRPGGVFILTGGMLGYNPWPSTSNIAMVNLGLEGFVRGAALDLQDARRIVIIHPPLINATAVQMGMDATPFPSAATVAETYLMALEGNMTGQPVFVEGYYPS
jgi:NAD(P)-dependent dehydrogenase (short-subunit alcohol dehydrogenase family)